MSRFQSSCSIAPPDLLAWLAVEGNPKQREAAVRALATSAAFRSQRAVVGHLSRRLNINTGALMGPELGSGKRLSVYDNQKQGRPFLPGVLVRDWGQPPVKDGAVNQAYDGSNATYEFYRDVFRRDSLDGKGLALVSSVHYGVAFDNAFWDGSQMVYGDGSGRIFQVGGLTKSVDVIGHELTHGVTEFTAGLAYSKQSGALNESFSDVFGILVKQYSRHQTAADSDWLIGEGTLVPSLGKALRSMINPGTANSGDRQPGTMAGYVDLPDNNDPRNDNGGVHINSGIPNHAFALAATALGGNAWETAGHIWYTVLTTQLAANAQFIDAANATVSTAGKLYDSTVQDAVHNAWQQVGVLP